MSVSFVSCSVWGAKRLTRGKGLPVWAGGGGSG